MATPATPILTPIFTPRLRPARTEFWGDNKDLETAWKDVQERVIQLAPGGKLQQDLDIEGVLRILDEAKETDNAALTRYSGIRSRFGKVLQCVRSVSGLLTTASPFSPVNASASISPATCCFNAITFVILAWRKYESIFENIARLFDRCADLMARLEYYKDKMDARLGRVACQHLQLFVAICERTIKLRRLHVRALTFVKINFLDDREIANFVIMMDQLIDRERNLVIAQTFRLTADMSTKVDTLVDGEKDRKKDADAVRWKKNIAKTLGFEDEMLDRDGEPVPRWEKLRNAYWASAIDRTGRWIHGNEAFRDWLKPPTPVSAPVPILVLVGCEGSGKTYMMANVLRHLLKVETAGPRPCRAYFFLESDHKRVGSRDKMENILIDVSRCLLWQCATATEPLMKSISGICERVKDFENSLDLWTQLLLENRDRQRLENTFHIFIDGMDDDISRAIPLLQKLTSSQTDGRIRVFMTAKPESLEVLASAGVSHASISIQDHNSQDVEAYINFRMDQMEMLRDVARRPEIAKWRARILDELRIKTGGDYFKLVKTLDAIATMDLVTDIEDILSEADRARSEQIDDELQRLNKTLKDSEIREVNEMVLWVTTAMDEVSLRQMEDILRLKQGAGTSLMSLESKIRLKYPLFKVMSYGIDWKSDEYADRIPQKNGRLRDDARGEDARLVAATGSKELLEAEVKIVEHFLKQVCPSDLYQRFDFGSFFERKRVARDRDLICRDDDNADLLIALTCLKVLTGPPRKDKALMLHKYAGENLLGHLERVDLSASDRELRKLVGSLLVRLFTEPSAIDALFWTSEEKATSAVWREMEWEWLSDIRDEWLYSGNGAEQVLRWCKDSAVARELTDAGHSAWLAAITIPNANVDEFLFRPAAVRLARHWLREDGFAFSNANMAMAFLFGYLAKVDPSILLPGEELEDKENMTIEQLGRIESWCEVALGHEAKDSVWETQMALATTMVVEDTEAGLSRAKKSFAMDGNNWMACLCLGSTIESLDEATEILQDTATKVSAHVRHDPSWLASSSHRALAATLNFELGQKLWDSALLLPTTPDSGGVGGGAGHGEGQGEAEEAASSQSAQPMATNKNKFAVAAEFHRAGLAYEPSRLVDYSEVFSQYSQMKAWDAVVALMECLNRRSDWESWLAEMVDEVVEGADFQEALARSAEELNRWDVVHEFFGRTSRVASSAHDGDVNVDLVVVQRAYLNTMRRGPPEANEAKMISVAESVVGRGFGGGGRGGFGGGGGGSGGGGGGEEVAEKDGNSNGGFTMSRSDLCQVANVLAQLYLRAAASAAKSAMAAVAAAAGQAASEAAPGAASATAGRAAVLPSLDQLDQMKYDQYAARLQGLTTHMAGWENIVVSCCLARYYQAVVSPVCAAKDNSKDQLAALRDAKKAIEPLLRICLELLSDDDVGNDDFAFWMLARVLTSLGDEENLIATWSMRNLIVQNQMKERQVWIEKQLETQASAGVAGSSSAEALTGDGCEAASQGTAGPLGTINETADEERGPRETHSQHAPAAADKGPQTQDGATQTETPLPPPIAVFDNIIPRKNSQPLEVYVSKEDGLEGTSLLEDPANPPPRARAASVIRIDTDLLKHQSPMPSLSTAASAADSDLQSQERAPIRRSESPGQAEDDHGGTGGTDGNDGDDDADNNSDDDDQAQEANNLNLNLNLNNSIPEQSHPLVTCDGCKEHYLIASDMYTCEDCVGTVQFDPPCYRLLMSGGLAQKKGTLCDRTHRFIRLPPWDEERMRRVKVGHIPVGERDVGLEEWKRGLREKYLDGLAVEATVKEDDSKGYYA